MFHATDRFVVVLDANVLYPFRMRDILLRFAEEGLYRARWTEEITAEWSQNLTKNKPHLESSVLSQIAAMRQVFPQCWVDGHMGLVSALTLPDPNERHVLAAAIQCSAQHIVTRNHKHFPDEGLLEFDVSAISPDDFLANTCELYEPEAIQLLQGVRRRLNNPPFTPAEFVKDLTAKDMPRLAMFAADYQSLL